MSWYIGVHACHHIRGAIGRPTEALGSDEVALIRQLAIAEGGSKNMAIAEACAVAVGHAQMLELADAAEKEGAWWAAVHLLYAASLPLRSREIDGLHMRNNINAAEENPLLLRVQQLLEEKLDGSHEANLMEWTVLVRGVVIGFTQLNTGKVSSERIEVLRLRNRQRELGSGMTIADAFAESLTAMMGCPDGMLGCWGSGKPEQRLTLPSAAEEMAFARSHIDRHDPLKVQ